MEAIGIGIRMTLPLFAQISEISYFCRTINEKKEEDLAKAILRIKQRFGKNMVLKEKVLYIID